VWSVFKMRENQMRENHGPLDTRTHC